MNLAIRYEFVKVLRTCQLLVATEIAIETELEFAKFIFPIQV